MNLIAQSIEGAELVTSAPNVTIKFMFKISLNCDSRRAGIIHDLMIYVSNRFFFRAAATEED